MIVLTSSSLEDQVRISEIAHSNKISFIVAETRGLFGQIFNDFGEDFKVIDTNGEEPISCMIASISQVILNFNIPSDCSKS